MFVATMDSPAFITKDSSPNEQINVGLIGCGSMGWGNLHAFLNLSNVRCTALCDVDSKRLQQRLQELEAIQERKAKGYSDYRHLLDASDVDVVIIATPDHWHCLQFIDACKAGKDVYLEKPIANSIAECEVMELTADTYQTVVQVGQQQRSSTMWKSMVDYIRSGALGQVGSTSIWANFNYPVLKTPAADSAPPEGVDYNMWLGPAGQRNFNRDRFHGSWRFFWDYGGGLMTDWGVHLIDMVIWALDTSALPVKTQAFGGNFLFPDGGHETFDTLRVNYQLTKSLLTWENNGGVESGPYGKNYGICFKGEKGAVVANRDSWSVLPERELIPAHTEDSDYQEHGLHAANFLDCVRRRDRNTNCPLSIGALNAKYAHLGNISARSGGTVLSYDEQKKTFHEKMADAFLTPSYRSPWRLDG